MWQKFMSFCFGCFGCFEFVLETNDFDSLSFQSIKLSGLDREAEPCASPRSDVNEE